MTDATMTRPPPSRSRPVPSSEAPDAAAGLHGATRAAVGALRALGLALALGAAATPAAAQPATARATFAGGCFWCVEADFDKVPGVLSTTSGYMGGTVPSPTYEQVVSKVTGHAEVVEIAFDPARVSYEQLLAVYWRSIDPTTKDRQFCDAGSPYRSAIFANDAAQLDAAKRSLQELERTKPFKEPIVTQIETASRFWPAEGYHQDYYKKNPVRYRHYRASCGRDARLEALWGKP
jgi:peptide-methionine (S)-S-oxide reductase